MELVFGMQSDIGNARKSNEDACIVYYSQAGIDVTKRGVLAAVADGIGSYRGGKQASSMAVEQLALFYKLPNSQYEGEQTLIDLILKTNTVMTQLQKQGKEYFGIGSTLTVCWFPPQGNKVVVLSTGDSVAYLFRSSRLIPITNPQRNEQSGELISHLGAGERLQLEKVTFQVAEQDIIVLCTDGVAGPLGLQGIKNVVEQNVHDMELCALHLTKAAAEKGDDNVTAICLKVVKT